jgi:hypothetical protein
MSKHRRTVRHYAADGEHVTMVGEPDHPAACTVPHTAEMAHVHTACGLDAGAPTEPVTDYPPEVTCPDCLTVHPVDDVTAVITVTLPLRVARDVPQSDLLDALRTLADVMGVQAEDGLWSAGSPDADDDDNHPVADVGGLRTDVQTRRTPDPAEPGEVTIRRRTVRRVKYAAPAVTR